MLSALSIFAGVDAGGAIRFVGDVSRGAACGCDCVACGAPLVARRGEIRNWHFAHEASQERPECFAGAVNLLRRLTISRLVDAGVSSLPTYRAQIGTSSPLPVFSETVSWTPSLFTVERWALEGPATAPVALLRLATGTAIHLFVDVNGGAEPRMEDVATEEGAVVYRVPLPYAPDQLRDHAAAVRHIDESGELMWLRCPDAETLQVATRTELDRRAQQAHNEAAMRRISIAAPLLTQAPPALLWSQPRPVEEIDASPWAAWRKRPHSFTFYGLKDGTAWVIFPHRDGRMFMMPYPDAFEGWDEAMPARIGTVDNKFGGLLLADVSQAMMYLGSLSRMIRTASTWSELMQLPWEH
jgi:hypothetical protein